MTVCNLILKIAQMKMPFIKMIMVMMNRIVKKKLMRKLINPNKFLNLSLYHHLHLCPLVLQSSLFILCKELEKVMQIFTDTEWYFWSLRALYRQGWKVFQGLFLKLVRSRNPKIKRFSTLPTRIVIALDEIYDTYVDFDDDRELDTDIYKILIRKASC